MHICLCRNEECKAVCFLASANSLCNIVQGVLEVHPTIIQSIVIKGIFRYTAKH